MIAAEVKMMSFYMATDREDSKIVVVHTGAMEEWCDANLGPKAEFRDQVSDEYPWSYSYSFGMTTWHFAREELATMFRLRWL